MESPATRIWRTVLIGLVVLGIVHRFYAITAWKHSLSNDESVSYMCAAASAGAWEVQIGGMVNRPITIAEIQRFYDRPDDLAFRTVALDMAMYDVHPPLYFWTLHLIHVCWGTGPGTGAYLNIVFGILALVLVHRLARRMLGGPLAPWVAVVAWYLSPAAVQIDLEARPYQLLTLLALASYLLGQRLIAGRGSRSLWLGFTAVNMLGLLTHLYFPFLLLPGLALMIWQHGPGRRVTIYLLSLVVSTFGMLMLYPEFITFLTTYGDRPRDVPEPVHSMERLKGVLYASMEFFTEGHRMRYLFLLLSTLTGGLLLWKRLRGFGRVWLQQGIGEKSFFITFGWWTLFTVALFLVGASPAQAVGEQYYAYLWPFAAIACTGTLGALTDQRWRRILLGLYLVQLIPAFVQGVRGSKYLVPAIPEEWNTIIASNDLLITDEAKRTALPRMARHLPAGLPLYIMGRQHPDLTNVERVVFLHLDIRSRPAAPFVDWLSTQGFAPTGALHTCDPYELRSFARNEDR